MDDDEMKNQIKKLLESVGISGPVSREAIQYADAASRIESMVKTLIEISASLSFRDCMKCLDIMAHHIENAGAGMRDYCEFIEGEERLKMAGGIRVSKK